MAEAGAEEFAQFGAAALDAFQALFEETEHLDHRGNDAHACELLGDLLIDLMHYAQHRGLEFNDILAQAHGHHLSESNSPDVYAIGATVQLDGPAADEAILLGHPTRGSITGLLVPNHGPTEYYVHFLGQTSNQKVISADLKTAPPFSATTTTQGLINDPLHAEELLIQTMTRIGQADIQGLRPHKGDLNDQRALLDALVAWNDMEKHNVTDLLLAEVAPYLSTDAQQPAPEIPLSPAQLAAQAFPTPLAEGLTDQLPAPHNTSEHRPATPAARRHSPGR
ncbi:hypothetical protein [Actinomadura livida]|uniref:Uncharacterized protein n=1 Tax=Actinomadura livida TaxID=79909 RepID=A0A7W7I7M6_9ACTN|nr:MULTISPECIES: hypothetical protein [Actinomadura]MBB4771928.1 hypothetical protein [Actinomadura catellatispora]GGU03467.1 hypothetical protein GCM10010208_29510 [Actinomadura livida]